MFITAIESIKRRGWKAVKLPNPELEELPIGTMPVLLLEKPNGDKWIDVAEIGFDEHEFGLQTYRRTYKHTEDGGEYVYPIRIKDEEEAELLEITDGIFRMITTEIIHLNNMFVEVLMK